MGEVGVKPMLFDFEHNPPEWGHSEPVVSLQTPLLLWVNMLAARLPTVAQVLLAC